MSRLPQDSRSWADERVENTVHRVVQESLTNIVRHAHASRALVAVRLDALQAEVVVADDGIGAAAADEGNGLRGLRERVQQLGGTVVVGAGNLPGSAHSGTSITVRIPAPQEEP